MVLFLLPQLAKGNLEISKNIFTDSVFISKVNYTPTWVFKGNTERGREYIILPSELSDEDSLYSFLSANDKKLMLEAFDDTKEIITKYKTTFRLSEDRKFTKY